jgi:hypothetical protein
MSTRLETIATRQRQSRLHTIVFATCLAIAGVISASAINTAVDAATPTVAQR